MEEKVLLVDDERDFLDALAARLEQRGLKVTASDSAERAVELVKKSSFDAVVLDLKMPGMDGLETLKAIKKIRPEIQVILLTGHATVQKGIQAVKLGAMDFLEKPADIETLMEKIKNAGAKKMILVEEKNMEKISDILSTKGW